MSIFIRLSLKKAPVLNVLLSTNVSLPIRGRVHLILATNLLLENIADIRLQEDIVKPKFHVQVFCK
jgi:hypothetical protein